MVSRGDSSAEAVRLALESAELEKGAAVREPFVAVAEFASIEEGLRAGCGAPFLVPECREFGLDAAGFRALLAGEQDDLFGYHYFSDTEYELRYVAPLMGLRRFEEGTLDFVIVDSPVREPARVLPAVLRGRAPDDEEGRQYACCFVLTGAGRVTPFHADPEFGGGYMHLLAGEKLWWLVDPADAPTEALVDRSIATVLTQDERKLWGKVQVALLRAGGFLYFPPLWSHRVRTLERSYGLGGYVTP